MSAITLDNDLVHYEVLGRGRPVILIHGWLGSWRYWIPTMQQLSVKYRVYALDLWGFGDTEKNSAKYGFESQVALLTDFMDKLGITKAALVGHALGAAITIDFARRHPDRAPRVMLVSPPLFDVGGLDAPAATNGSTSAAISPTPTPATHPLPLTDKAASPAVIPASPTTQPTNPAGSVTPATAAAAAPTAPQPDVDHTRDTLRRNPFLDNPEQLALLQAAAKSNITTARSTGSMPVVTTPAQAPAAASPVSKPHQPNPIVTLLNTARPKPLLEKQLPRTDENLEKLLVEVEKMDESALSRSAGSFAGVNLALALHQLTVPALLFHGKDDLFLPAPDEDLLARISAGKPDGLFLPFVAQAFRHFPMLESAIKFNRLLMDFLDAPDLTNVQLKETWKRQLR